MSDSRIQYRKLRAPQKHGGFLVEPPLSESTQLVRTNQELIAKSADLIIAGRPLHELRHSARKELIQLALEFSGDRLSEPAQVDADLIFLSGHQPKLFHPGVWFKNVLLHQLAQRHQAIAINLIIDNDLCGLPSIAVPTGSLDSPQITQFEFDTEQSNLPFEEVDVQSPERFDSFSERVLESALTANRDPLLTQYWDYVRQSPQSNVGLKLAYARHSLECQHGIQNLELPLSTICQTSEFLLFCLHLMKNAGLLRETYNQSLASYRQVHKIRSQSHPVPALTQMESAIELPLWFWTSDAPSRQSLFCKPLENEIELLDGSGVSLGKINLTAGNDEAVNQLQVLCQRGLKIRPRALTTTMYCRLVLGDLFLHGIGGGKYDQLTDDIAEQFLGVSLPRIQIATSTIKLFDEQIVNPQQELDEVNQDLRALEFSPDKVAQKAIENGHKAGAELAQLMEEKRQHVQQTVPPEQRPAWHQTLQEIHQKIKLILADEEERLLNTKIQLEKQQLNFQLLDSREFSLVLFNGKTLLDLLVSATNTP